MKALLLPVYIAFVFAAHGGDLPREFLTAESVAGVYEAVGVDDLRIFRLEIRTNNTAMIVMSLQIVDEPAWNLTFVSTNCLIHEGTITIQMAESDSIGPNKGIAIVGMVADGGEDSTVIRAGLWFEGGKDDRPRWNLRFVKMSRGVYADAIRSLARAAEMCEASVKTNLLEPGGFPPRGRRAQPKPK